jgi:hypothetical protein
VKWEGKIDVRDEISSLLVQVWELPKLGSSDSTSFYSRKVDTCHNVRCSVEDYLEYYLTGSTINEFE